jgi:flagellar motor switch protein FliN/FliY
MADTSALRSAEAAAQAAGDLLAEAAHLDSPGNSPDGTASAAPDSGPPAAPGLLRIGVTVAVTLASQPKSIREIVELVPGAIIKFDKTCDEPLELCVCDRPIATGEVVKVGDKFGLRVGRLLKNCVSR